jgi:protein-tyrosine-phosphatase
MKVLFVCIGNTCRSPMAEALFNYEASNLKNKGEARSAGTSPHTHIMKETVEVMDEIGLDVSEHVPKLLSNDMIRWADKIVLLDKSIIGRLFNVPIDKKEDIIIWHTDDPYKMSKENFRRVRNLLHKKICNFIESK